MGLTIRSVNKIKANPLVTGAKVNPLTYLNQQLKVAAYCRVSTEFEEQQSSFETQVNFYTEYINANPKWELVSIYADDGASGTQIYWRNGFMKMLEDAREKKFDLLITKSFSRFARNTVDTINIVREFRSLGIDILFEDMNLHTMDTSGELMITIFSAIAQEENRNLSKNVTWGYQKKFERGETLIPSTMMGYQKHAGQIEINSKEAQVVRLIASLFLDGMSCYGIKTYLEAHHIKAKKGSKTWSVTTIESMLKNEKYTGNSLLQKTICTDYLTKERKKNEGERHQYYVKDSHPAIYSQDVYDLIQGEFKLRKLSKEESLVSTDFSAGRSKKSTQYYLNQVLFCKECKEPFRRYTWTARGKTEYRWMCRCRKQPKGREKCPLSPSIIEENLHEAIMQAIRKICGKMEYIEASKTTSKRLETLNEEIQLYEALLKECVNESHLDALSILKLERSKIQYLNRRSNAVAEKIDEAELAVYSDELVKKLIRKIEVTRKGFLEIEFITGAKVTQQCNCQLA